MNTAEIINLCVGICTALTAIASVIIAVLTLKQNNKMIRNSTRPYITISFRPTNFQDYRLYIVIKNYGASGAVITNLEFSESLEEIGITKNSKPPFDGVKGVFLAPGQSIVCPIDTKAFREKNIDCVYADISYKDNIEEYKERYPLNYIVYGKNPVVRANTQDKELKIISYTLQDLVEKQL